MKKLAATLAVLILCVSLTATARAEKYDLSCSGPGIGGGGGPVKVGIDTAKKAFVMAGEANSEFAMDGNELSAMVGSNMYQLNLSSMEGVALTDGGFSNFKCQKN